MPLAFSPLSPTPHPLTPTGAAAPPAKAQADYYGRSPQELEFEKTLTYHDPIKVINFILQNNPDPETRALAVAMKAGGFGNYRIKAPADYSGDPDYMNNTSVESETQVGDGVLGVTVPHAGGGVSSIVERKAGNNQYPETRQTVLHEMVHAYLMNRYGASILDRNEIGGAYAPSKARAAKELQKFLDDWRELSIGSDSTSGRLAFKDSKRKEIVGLDEFVKSPDEGIAYILTNPDLRNYLKTVDKKGRALESKDPDLSAWDHFARHVKTLFGLDMTRQPAEAYVLDDAMAAIRGAWADKPNADLSGMVKGGAWYVDKDPPKEPRR